MKIIKLFSFLGKIVFFLWILIILVINPFFLAPTIEKEFAQIITNIRKENPKSQLQLISYQRGLFASQAEVHIYVPLLGKTISQTLSIDHAPLGLGAFNIIRIHGENKDFYPLDFQVAATIFTHLTGEITFHNRENDHLSWQSSLFSPKQGILTSNGMHIHYNNMVAQLEPWQGKVSLDKKSTFSTAALALTLQKDGLVRHINAQDLNIDFLQTSRQFIVSINQISTEILSKQQYLNQFYFSTFLPIQPDHVIQMHFVPELTIPFIKTINGQWIEIKGENHHLHVQGNNKIGENIGHSQWQFTGDFPNPPFGSGQLFITKDFMKQSRLLMLLQYQLGTLQTDLQGNYFLPIQVTPNQLVINGQSILSFKNQ